MTRKLGVMRLGIGVLILSTSLTSANCARQNSQSEDESDPPPELAVPAPEARVETVQDPSGEDVFGKWVGSQLEVNNPSFVKIVDRKLWPMAPDPNTSIVLGLARRPPQWRGPGFETVPYHYFPFVLIIQSVPEGSTPPFKLLALIYLEDLRFSEPKTIDITPIQILKDEHAFGLKLLTGSLGNKSGGLYEVVSLLRYRNGFLTEIFRDAVWAFSLYSEKDYQSCNVDMELVSDPSAQGGFFTITTRYKRSYLGRERLSPDANVPDTACTLTESLRTPRTHVWSPEKGRYLDPKGRFLDLDDFFSGWPNLP